MDDADRMARTRFFIIGAVRLAGAITVALAVAVVLGRIAIVPQLAGYGLLLVGAVEMIVVPKFLVAKWKSPPSA